jgi:hypothetical protein
MDKIDKFLVEAQEHKFKVNDKIVIDKKGYEHHKKKGKVIKWKPNPSYGSPFYSVKLDSGVVVNFLDASYLRKG